MKIPEKPVFYHFRCCLMTNYLGNSRSKSIASCLVFFSPFFQEYVLQKTKKNQPVCILYTCPMFCAKARKIFLLPLLTPALPNPKLSKPLLDIFTVA